MLYLAVFLVILSPYTALIPAAAIGYRIYKNEMNIELNASNMSILAIFCWAFISGITNFDYKSTFMSLGLLFYLFMNSYINNEFKEENRVEQLAHVVMMLSLVAVGVGFVEKAASYYIDMSWIDKFYWTPTYDPTKGAYRIFSTFGNPNVAGGWFAAMMLICLHFIDNSIGREKVKYIAVALLFALALVLTGSRGAIVGFEAGLLVYASIKRTREAVIPVVASMIAIFFLMMFVPEINHSVGSRQYIWDAALEMFKREPITGYGLLGTLNEIGEIHAHNIWITVIADLGIIGILLYSIFRFNVLYSLRLLYENGSKTVALLASIQGLMMAHGLVDFIIISPQGGMMFFASSAMITALAEKYAVAADAKITDKIES